MYQYVCTVCNFAIELHSEINLDIAHHQNASQRHAFPNAIYSGWRSHQKMAHVIHIENDQDGIARRGADLPVCVAAKRSDR